MDSKKIKGGHVVISICETLFHDREISKLNGYANKVRTSLVISSQDCLTKMLERLPTCLAQSLAGSTLADALASSLVKEFEDIIKINKEAVYKDKLDRGYYVYLTLGGLKAKEYEDKNLTQLIANRASDLIKQMFECGSYVVPVFNVDSKDRDFRQNEFDLAFIHLEKNEISNKTKKTIRNQKSKNL